jgi:simple sugar transport system ATP-binding protein
VIPEDRHREGLLLEQSLGENFLLGLHRSEGFSRGGILDASHCEREAARALEEHDVRPRDPGAIAGALSGGNQQKLIFAREMRRNPKFILAAQPTRGVDVGAIEFIHARLRAAREAGKAILLVSAELTEILALADRIAVMYGGKIVGVLPREEASEDVLGPLMTGAGGAVAGGVA